MRDLKLLLHSSDARSDWNYDNVDSTTFFSSAKRFIERAILNELVVLVIIHHFGVLFFSASPGGDYKGPQKNSLSFLTRAFAAASIFV